MKLRHKTALIIVATMTCLIGLLYIITSHILLNNIREAEKHQIEQKVEGFVSLFNKVQHNSSTPFADWAHWDAPYYFVQDHNQAFIDENLSLNTIGVLKLNMMLFINKQEQFVHGIGFDQIHLTLDMLPPAIQQVIQPNSLFLKHPHVHSIHMGLLLLEDKLFWIVTLPLLKNEAKGEMMGNLVVGRYLEDDFWQDLVQVTNLKLELHRLDELNLPVDFETALTRISTDNKIISIPQNNEIIGGYATLNDIYNKPALILRLDAPRIIFKYGRQSIQYLIISLTIIGILFVIIVLLLMEKLIVSRLANLSADVEKVGVSGNLSLRVTIAGKDELLILANNINKMLSGLEYSQNEIAILNQKLQVENLRMGAELEISRQLQQMVLPTQEELNKIKELDIAAFMVAADEVGGDYYDILQHEGLIKIGIGDVTGHGLASGVLMLMVQMAVRTLLINGVTDPKIFLDVLNRAMYSNVQRMNSDKNLTLLLIDYHRGVLHLSGQHEEILLIRQTTGLVERIDTFDLGFIVGLEEDISGFITNMEITLQPGDGIVLYTDGITEAMDMDKNQYGIERLCAIISQSWYQSAITIQHAVIEDVHRFIGKQKVFDDITLLVLKQR